MSTQLTINFVKPHFKGKLMSRFEGMNIDRIRRWSPNRGTILERNEKEWQWYKSGLLIGFLSHLQARNPLLD